VLMAGGQASPGSPSLASAELYNIATGTFTPTGSLTTARELHTATPFAGGETLGLTMIAGGDNSTGYLASAELYTPETGTFAATGSMNTARYVCTATLLYSSEVLMAGGFGNNGYLASAELFSPAYGTFTFTSGTLNTARYLHTATLLNNHTVLITGGRGRTGYLASAELYSP